MVLFLHLLGVKGIFQSSHHSSVLHAKRYFFDLAGVILTYEGMITDFVQFRYNATEVDICV